MVVMKEKNAKDSKDRKVKRDGKDRKVLKTWEKEN